MRYCHVALNFSRHVHPHQPLFMVSGMIARCVCVRSSDIPELVISPRSHSEVQEISYVQQSAPNLLMCTGSAPRYP